MKILYSRKFSVNFKKMPVSLKKILQEQVNLFRKTPNDPSLCDHPLRGNLEGFRAFSVTADIRVVYSLHGKDTVEFDDIGPHTKVYKG